KRGRVWRGWTNLGGDIEVRCSVNTIGEIIVYGVLHGGNEGEAWII
ncbi:hypothetical protein MTR67_034475, partial [Solanum verrucosum]